MFQGAPNGTQHLAGSVSSSIPLSISATSTPVEVLLTSVPRGANLTNYDLTAVIAAFGPSGSVGIVSVKDATTGATLASRRLNPVQSSLGFPVVSGYVAGNISTAVAAGDLNGDGIPDLVSLDEYGSTLYVLLGDAANAGNFLPPVAMPLPSQLADLAIADINADGLLDLVVTGLSPSTLYVLLGDPAQPGHFLAPVAYPLDVAPAQVVVGDVNGDGVLDVVVAAQSYGLTVFLGDPVQRGQLTAPLFSSSEYALTGQLTLLDINGDGALDVFGGFGYFPGDPAHPGQFLPAVGLGQGSCFPSFCAAADLNADGLPDLVAPGTPTQIWFNDPAHPGTFQLQAFSLPVTSRRVVVDDVNGDGSPDIIAATGNGITVFLADPKRPGRFLQQATSSGGEVWPVFADFNGDGIPDMAAEGVTVTLGSYFQTVQFSAIGLSGAGLHNLEAVYSGDRSDASAASADLPLTLPQPTLTTLSATPASGAFGTIVTVTASVSVSGNAVTRGDVQFFDGKKLIATATIVTGTGMATFKTAFGQGQHSLTASFMGTPYAPQVAAPSTSQPAVIQINGQQPSTTVVSEVVNSANHAQFDFTASVAGSGSAAPTGTLTFSEAAAGTMQTITLPGTATRQFLPEMFAVADTHVATTAVADLNQDGTPDLIVTHGTYGTLSVFLGIPGKPGQYQPAVTYNSSSPFLHPGAVAVGDMNGDGLLDLVVANAVFPYPQTTAGIDIFLNDPQHPGQLLGPQSYPFSGNNPATSLGFVVISDLNRDGIPDVAVSTTSRTSCCLGSVVVFLADPRNPGSYSQSAYYLPLYDASYIGVADFDNDGAPDILYDTGRVLYGDPSRIGHFQLRELVTFAIAPDVGFTGEVVGDFNQDGLPDVAVSSGDNKVTIFLNDPGSPGSFPSPQSYPINNNALSSTNLVTGDFNGDGILDLAEGDPATNTVTALLGDPNHPGQFGRQTIYPIAGSDNYIAAADLAGNGLSSLLIPDATGVEVLQAGATEPVALSDVGFPPGLHTVVANYSGDAQYTPSSGSVTIGVPYPTSAVLSVSPPTAAYGTPITLTAIVSEPQNPSNPKNTGGVVQFFDGKRLLGTAAVAVTGNAAGMAILTTQSFTPGAHTLTAVYSGAPGFALASASVSATAALTITGRAPSSTTLSAIPNAIAKTNYDLTATVSANGTAVPTGNVTFSNIVTNAVLASLPLPQTSAIGFSSPILSDMPVAPSSLISGDFNGDGALDLAYIDVQSTTSYLAILPGLPKNPGHFGLQTEFPLGEPVSDGAYIATADFNGDGLPDFAITGQAATHILLLLSDVAHPGSFLAPQSISVPVDYYHTDLAIGDFNGDGAPDIVLIAPSENAAAVLLSVPGQPGTFSSPSTVPLASTVDHLAIGDFNADGVLDIAFTYGLSTNGVGIALGDLNHPGQFLAPVLYPTSASPKALQVADFNGDGLPDLAISEGYLESVKIDLFLNNPASPGALLSEQATGISGEGSLSSAMTDVNGDGLPDLILEPPSNSSNVITIGLSDAAHPGQFLPQINFPISNIVSTAVGDFAGQGLGGLALVSTYPEPHVSVFPAQQAGSVTLPNLALADISGQVVTATYSGDSIYLPSGSDLVALPSGGNQPTAILLPQPLPLAPLGGTSCSPQLSPG